MNEKDTASVEVTEAEISTIAAVLRDSGCLWWNLPDVATRQLSINLVEAITALRQSQLEEAGDALMAWDNNLLTAPGIAPEYRAAVQRFGDVLGVPAETPEKENEDGK